MITDSDSKGSKLTLKSEFIEIINSRPKELLNNEDTTVTIEEDTQTFYVSMDNEILHNVQ